MTIKEVESKTVWPVQSLAEEGKPGIQVRNLAGVENPSCISRFPAGTLPSLEPTKSRTTRTRSRIHRGRFRMGGRKDRQE